MATIPDSGFRIPYHRFKAAKKGDPLAKDALTSRLRPRVLKMARYYARRTGEDADDLLQEAWVGLLEALPELDLTIGSPEEHLIKRARWRLLDAIKRARVRRCAQLEEEVADHAAGRALETAVAAALVSDFLKGLNTVQRDVMECLLAGFTWREAGRVLGCTSANIAYHVRQIRRQYEEWIAEPLASGVVSSTKTMEARSRLRLQKEVGE